MKRGHDKITVIFPVTSDNFLSTATALFTGDIYIYLEFLYYASVFTISFDLVTFSAVFMFVMISLTNYANTSCIIIDLCWF